MNCCAAHVFQGYVKLSQMSQWDLNSYDFLPFILCEPMLPLWRRQWQPTPVLLPGKSPRRKSLVGCSPWDRKESDMTEQLHFHFSLSCIGEGNDNPLQCSCLENPRDGGPWWVAVYGVTQSQTQLKQLSSSSMLPLRDHCFTSKCLQTTKVDNILF